MGYLVGDRCGLRDLRSGWLGDTLVTGAFQNGRALYCDVVFLRGTAQGIGLGHSGQTHFYGGLYKILSEINRILQFQYLHQFVSGLFPLLQGE